MTTKDCGHPGSACARQERSEGVKERQVCLAGPVLFDASSARDEERAGAATGADHEFIRQRGLANPRFSSDQERAPAFCHRLIEGLVELTQLLLATHDVPWFGVNGRRGCVATPRGTLRHHIAHQTERLFELGGGISVLPILRQRSAG